MFIEERHRKICEMVQEKGRVEVPELTKIFAVSEDSIRRDLRIMEKQGFLKRTYGGAIKSDQVGQALLYKDREMLHAKIKKKIAAAAVAAIRDHDTILLDGSTTVATMVSFLNEKIDLTIITNSIIIANQVLSEPSEHQLFMTGGVVDRETSNITSSSGLQAIRQITADKVFICPCGISAEWGLSDTSFEEAAIKKAMIEAGKEVFILADSSKLGQRFLACVGPLQPEYTIITDRDFSEEACRDYDELIRQGMNVICVE